ncbi:DNA alkylation repair protein [Celeribacter sp. SCSIO 80788]|uniref:DNA alkylation repair protein n=1 Tax=Celeribacter sp. SCSIO 80788 TaxID=3117013 RepID=UPI003DA690C4
MTKENVMNRLKAAADAQRASDLEARFGAGSYFGVPPQALEDMARALRQDIAFPERLSVAQHLWDSGVFDARLMAAKLLTQARISDDAAVWTQICDWLDAAENWAVLDALAKAGSRRLMADLSRMERVALWAEQDAPLPRRAALLLTEPLAKLSHPSEAEAAALDRACDWLPGCLEDGEKDVNRVAESWLRALSKHHFKRAKLIRTARG